MQKDRPAQKFISTGCLIGPETGKALGTTLEFTPPGISEPIAGILDGSPFNPDPCQRTGVNACAVRGRIPLFLDLEKHAYTNGISVVYPYGKVGSRAIP